MHYHDRNRGHILVLNRSLSLVHNLNFKYDHNHSPNPNPSLSSQKAPPARRPRYAVPD